MVIARRKEALHHPVAQDQSQTVPTMIGMDDQVCKRSTKGKGVARTTRIVNRARCSNEGVACGMPEHEQAMREDTFQVVVPVCISYVPPFLFKERQQRLLITGMVGTKRITSGKWEMLQSRQWFGGPEQIGCW